MDLNTTGLSVTIYCSELFIYFKSSSFLESLKDIFKFYYIPNQIFVFPNYVPSRQSYKKKIKQIWFFF